MKILIGCVAFFLTAYVAKAVTLHEGILKGAPYKVAVPAAWDSGKVFFHVNGWRPADAPHEADLDLSDPFYESLLADGWVLGRTAFLENGVDHDAHTAALRDLREWIETELGAVEMLVLEGESTAGTLVLRIAEQDADLADGVIAMGAFIELEDSTADAYLSAQPLRPAILMSNQTEIVGPISYVAKAEASASAVTLAGLRPLLRPGHVNVNWVERRAALDAMQACIANGELAIFSNGTRKVPSRKRSSYSEGAYLTNAVVAVNPYFGNALLDFHPDEFSAIGISKGDAFELVTHGEARKVVFGDSYGDVPPGEWVAFPTADERILLVRNHKSAIATAAIGVGDAVMIRALD